MDKKVIATEKAPKAIGPYSQGMQFGNLVFTSGQLPINPHNDELIVDIEAATKQSLENVKAILESAGSSMESVIKTVVFLKDMNDFPKMNAVYQTFFQNNEPARSAVQIAKLPKDAVVEIEAIACVK